MPRRLLLTAALSVALAACRSDAPSDALPAPRLTMISTPAPEGSMHPGATVTPTGHLLLSWQVMAPDSGVSLHFAERMGADWAPARLVPTGAEMLINSADVPSVAVLDNGVMAASWRGRHGGKGYDVYYASSVDAGERWSMPRMAHGDGTEMEHGFVSWITLGREPAMVWVDGRNNADADSSLHATQLAMATIDTAGALSETSFLDTKICDCCHTSSAVAAGSTVIAYRDRKDGEVRDISVARWTDGGWRLPVVVHEDNWVINGCPVNGPSIAAQGTSVAVAWFTAADQQPRVRVAFSDDTATTFAKPIEVHEGIPGGKVGLVLLPSGDALVSWIELKDAASLLRVRRITRGGARSPMLEVASLGEGKRAGGMPKFVLAGDEALLTWTDPVTRRVAVARIE